MHKELLKAWQFRHACKEFDPEKKINEKDFHTILEGGRLSPSSFGFEPWHFIVIQNKEFQETVGAIAWGGQKQIQTASHVVVILARKSETMTPDSEYVRKTILNETRCLPEEIIDMVAQKYGTFLQNDFELTFGTRACFEWVARQTYIALANMMTAAALLEIDSCPIEGFPKQALEDFFAQRGMVDPASFGVACLVAFGYRAGDPPQKTRRPEAKVVSWVR